MDTKQKTRKFMPVKKKYQATSKSHSNLKVQPQEVYKSVCALDYTVVNCYLKGARHRSKAVLLLWIISVIYVFLRLFVAVVWQHVGKRLTSWLSYVMFICVFVLCQVWYLIVSIPDLCHLSYFEVLSNSLWILMWNFG